MKVTWAPERQLRKRRSTQPCDDPGDAVSEIGGSRRKHMRNPDGPEQSDDYKSVSSDDGRGHV